MTAIQLLTSDLVRAEQLGSYLTHDWRGVPALRAGWSVGFGPVTKVLFLQDVGTGGEPPPTPVVPERFALERRERQWLEVVNPHPPERGEATTFELRTYDVRVGLEATFLELMMGALPIRERHSRNFGVWRSLSGRDGQVLHLWGYRDLDERGRVRARLKDDGDWQAYVATILPMLQSLDSIVLTPLPLIQSGRETSNG